MHGPQSKFKREDTRIVAWRRREPCDRSKLSSGLCGGLCRVKFVMVRGPWTLWHMAGIVDAVVDHCKYLLCGGNPNHNWLWRIMLGWRLLAASHFWTTSKGSNLTVQRYKSRCHGGKKVLDGFVGEHEWGGCMTGRYSECQVLQERGLRLINLDTTRRNRLSFHLHPDYKTVLDCSHIVLVPGCERLYEAFRSPADEALSNPLMSFVGGFVFFSRLNIRKQFQTFFLFFDYSSHILLKYLNYIFNYGCSRRLYDPLRVIR